MEIILKRIETVFRSQNHLFWIWVLFFTVMAKITQNVSKILILTPKMVPNIYWNISTWLDLKKKSYNPSVIHFLHFMVNWHLDCKTLPQNWLFLRISWSWRHWKTIPVTWHPFILAQIKNIITLNPTVYFPINPPSPQVYQISAN